MNRPDDSRRARCPQCALTREERAEYANNCPMVAPERFCPLFDPRPPTALVTVSITAKDLFMSDHVQLFINGAQVYDSHATPAPIPPDPEPIPPDPVPPNPTDPAYAFDWAKTGQVIVHQLEANKLYTYATTIPAGYAGPLGHTLVPQSSGTPQYISTVEMWESWEPGGPAIAPTHYKGAVSLGMPFPNAMFQVQPSGAQPCYFNLRLSTGGNIGVQQARGA